MIHLRLAGGLGNQIFQIAASLILSRAYENQIIVHTSSLQSYKAKRALELPKIMDTSDICFSNDKLLPAPLLLRLPRIMPSKIFGDWLISDKNLALVLSRDSCSGSLFLDGYFIESISQCIFQEMVKEVKNRAYPNQSMEVDGITCAIHIRGGDFLAQGGELPDIQYYYKRSIEEVLERNRATRFITVTDDQLYAQSLLSGCGIDYELTSGDLASDFYKIASANYAVLSNSTFAFWAGALRGASFEKTTWLPSLWRPGRRRKILVESE